jgi:sigma-E factor negative regulatory protein RseA
MERISAFMDGEVEDGESLAQVARLKQDASLRQAWETYHVIGDALRGETGHAPGFMGRFSAALEQEPTVLAPQRPAARFTVRRVALSLAASFGGVALVAWLALSNNPINPLVPGDGQLAAKPAVPAMTLAGAPANGAVNDYIMAHQQFSPSTAMQGLAPYIRTVSGQETADMR